MTLLRSNIFLFVFLFASPLWAQEASPQTCTDLFFTKPTLWQEIKSPFQNFVGEFKKDGAVRVVLKDEVKNNDKTQYWGFVSPKATAGPIRKYLRQIMGDVPSRVLATIFGPQFRMSDVTPLKGLYYIAETIIPKMFAAPYKYIIEKPTLALTEKYLGRRKQPVFLVKFAAIATTGFFTGMALNQAFSLDAVQDLRQQIREDSTTIQYVMMHDYRYKDINDDYIKGKISRDEALMQTSLMFVAYHQYYSARNLKEEAMTLESEMPLLDKLLFSSLREKILYGVTGPIRGFAVPQSSLGPLNDNQKLALIKLQHQLYLRYQAAAQLAEFLNDPNFRGFFALPDFMEIDRQLRAGEITPEVHKKLTRLKLFDNEHYFETIKGILEELKRDSFAYELIKRHQEKKITAGQVQYYLQEDQSWQIRFSQWAVLGITRLKFENGKITNEPLTLQDIRREILADIDRN